MQSGQTEEVLMGQLKNKIWPFIPPSGKYLLKKLKYKSIPAILLRITPILLRITYLRRFVRVQKLPTLILKPLDRINHYFIEINLGYKCNLRCFNCEASCRQAPSQESMSLEQINKFIDESIKQGRKWKIITIVGGEPTLHPQIFDILQQLLLYKKCFSRDAKIRIFSNGAGEKVNSILSKIPQEIMIENTKKNLILISLHLLTLHPKILFYINMPITQMAVVNLNYAEWGLTYMDFILA